MLYSTPNLRNVVGYYIVASTLSLSQDFQGLLGGIEQKA